MVERCSGANCTSFAQIGTAAATPYNDTGVIANTSYSYRVRAADAAGNLGAYSNLTGATTPTLAVGVGGGLFLQRRKWQFHRRLVRPWEHGNHLGRNMDHVRKIRKRARLQRNRRAGND